MSTEPVAYRASGQLTSSYRAFMERYHVARISVRDYNDAHPDHPLWVWKSSIDHDILVRGFADVRPDREPPAGLSRKQGRGYLIPARGAAGAAWRKLLVDYSRFPNAEVDVFKANGVPMQVFDALRIHVAGLFDFGEHGVFLRIGVAYDKPVDHLTPVPLSEFYAAKEAHEAAQQAVVL